MIDITGIDKAELLAAMVNGAQTMGNGFLQDRGGMSLEEAREWITKGWSHDFEYGSPQGRNHGRDRLYFDYVQGRPLKTDLFGDEVDPWGYDRDHGQGALQSIVHLLRAMHRA